MLTNVLYAGQVRHKDQVYLGEHPGIVDAQVFDRVQAQLQENGRSGGTEARNKYGALLKGLLYCTRCGCSMVHHYSMKRNKRYQYYVCLSAQKRGWDSCPAPSLPAGEIEQFVVGQIRQIGRDPSLVRETLIKTQEHQKQITHSLQSELAAIQRQRHRDETELQKTAGTITQETSDTSLARLADLQERLRQANQRSSEILDELDGLQAEQIDESAVAEALSEFDEMWSHLSPKEQGRVLHLLIDRVDHDGATGDITLTFHPTGLVSLSEALEEHAA